MNKKRVVYFTQTFLDSSPIRLSFTGQSSHFYPCHWYERWMPTIISCLRWPNTVFARAFADAIQRAHKDCKKQTCRQQSDHFIYSTPALSALFFSVIERSILMALVFYYKDMLEKVTTQKTQQFSAFSLLPKEPS